VSPSFPVPAGAPRSAGPTLLENAMIRLAPTALILLSLGACLPETAEDPASESEHAGVSNGESPAYAEAAGDAGNADARSVVQAFHGALAEADSAGALALLHPEAVIYESGVAETVEEYRAGHLAADIRFAAATEREAFNEQSVGLGRDVLYLAETRVQGRMGEREIDSRGVETMILTPRGDGWVIRHIHWSHR